MPAPIAFEAATYALPQGRVLLDALSLEVAEGERLVLLGRSGCGKTTTLKLINRLLTPTGGAVRVLGRPTAEQDPIALRRQVGYVLQDGGLFPHRSVADNVATLPRLQGWPEPKVQARVAELLHRMGLEPAQFAERFPRELSGGQRQRVGIARALAIAPPILLFDEPFSALDPIIRQELQLMVRALSRELGTTMVVVTHDLREAEVLGDRVAFLREGRLAYLGPPAGLGACSDPEVQAFMATLAPIEALEGGAP